MNFHMAKGLDIKGLAQPGLAEAGDDSVTIQAFLQPVLAGMRPEVTAGRV